MQTADFSLPAEPKSPGKGLGRWAWWDLHCAGALGLLLLSPGDGEKAGGGG